MKKTIAAVLGVVALVGFSLPAFADTDGSTELKNTRVGTQNVATGWVEVLDSTHEELSKGKNPGDHAAGLVAGTAIGVRKGIHRMGAGAIDLLTFWIPKKQPLVTPEKARLQ